jgi:hypothetical protein
MLKILLFPAIILLILLFFKHFLSKNHFFLYVFIIKMDFFCKKLLVFAYFKHFKQNFKHFKQNNCWKQQNFKQF